MRNSKAIQSSKSLRIALLLFAAMLAVVILVFPSIVEVSAEVTGAGIYQITNEYVENNYSSYGTFYLRSENGSVALSTYTYGNNLDNLYRYWYFDYQGNNQYLIRNMGDYSKALSVSGGDAVLTSVSSATKWILQESNYGGYQLLCESNTANDLLSVLSAPVEIANPVHHTVDVCVGAVADMAFDSWNIEPVNINGLYFQKTSDGKLYNTFHQTRSIDTGSLSLSSMGYTIKAISSANGLITPSSVTWTSSNASVATVNSGGTVTFVGGGRTTITASTMVNSISQSISYTLDVKVLNDGTYFLRNIESGLYADMEGTTVSSGVPVEKWTFDGSDSEKWNFTHLGANVYTITIGSNSSYYMGVASGAVNDEPGIVLYTGTVTDRMKWKVERGNAGYKIVSYLNSGYVLAVDTDGTSPGENLILGDWRDNTSYKDEWNLYGIKTTVNLDLIYDNAYLSRYSNAVSRLNGELLKLQEKYVTEFGVMVECDGPHKFDSYADTSCSASWDQKCSHGTCANSWEDDIQAYHHKNIHNIMWRIPFPNITQTFRVAYIGHSTCMKGYHSGEVACLGLTYPYYGLLSVTNFSSVANEAKTLIHEFGHLYNAPDHSGLGDTPTTAEIIQLTGNTGFNQSCIYGEDKDVESVINNLTICDGCRSFIESNVNNFNHG